MPKPDHYVKLPVSTAITQAEWNKFNEAEIFANALEIDDLVARNEYLDQVAARDTIQRHRLDSLLACARSTSDFLEPTATTEPCLDAPRVESVGDWLGPYRLLQQIGEGGMGTVYMAEQISPLKRQVAIKVIKPGMDSAQVMARFEAERQALAMMEHTNIARAIDVGVSAFGRTYFVMELVKGVPITQYCDELRLSTRKRLELFIPVCSAIQHAHQKGIIHRDLKPSNVLVAEYDGVAVPKVIDFGVAKAVHQQLTCRTLFTQFGQIVGTMEYMSPEQSRVNQLDIDTRSDVYSLGVLLYELITGTTPIQRQDLKELSWDELARLIREEDAPSPSQRLSTIERIQLVAQQRNTDPGKLSGIVKGELDWIVLKALDKQRSRRYQSASELADDLLRYLQGREVLACPPSTSYRIRKYIQKHRVVLLASALVTAALCLGLVGTSWQAWQASVARSQAELQRDIANAQMQQAQEAQALAQREAERSTREAEITKAVAGFVNDDLIAFADPSLEPNRDVRLREIVDRASDRVVSLHMAPLVEASIRFTLAKSYLGLGEFRKALGHAEASWKLRLSHLGPRDAQTIESKLLVAESELKLSRFAKASESYREAMLSSQESQSEESLLTLNCQHGYGVALAKLGKLEDARRILESVVEARRHKLGVNHVPTLETERELAELLFQKGEYLKAKISFESTIENITESLGESHPLTLKAMAGAASVASELGESDEAKRLLEQILQRQDRVLGDRHPDRLLTVSNLTLVEEVKRSPAAALAKNEQLMKIAEEDLGATHAVSQSIALTIADLLMSQGNTAKAIDCLQKSQAALSELHHGASPDLLRVQARVAGCYLFEGKHQLALQLYRETLEQQQLVLSAAHLDTLKTQFVYADALMSTGSYLDAEQSLSSLIEKVRDSDLRAHPLLLLAESKLASLESVLGRQASLDRHQAARRLASDRFGAYSSIALQLDIALAESLLRFGRVVEAKKILEKDLAVLETHIDQSHPMHGQLQDSLIESLVGLGDFQQAMKMSHELLAFRKSKFGVQHPLTLKSQNQLGVLLVQGGDPEQGVKLIREAFDRCRACFGRQFPLTLTCQQNLASTLGLLSVRNRSHRRETLSLYEDLLSIQSAGGVDHPDYLFGQLGYAGALAQQGRLLQAERTYMSLLPKLIKTFGEAHPFSNRCRENLASVFGSLGKYSEAIELSQAILDLQPAASPPPRKVIHAAIEYHICAGSVLEAVPLYEMAFEISSKPNVDLDWLFLDIPFVVDALENSVEENSVEEISHAENLGAENSGAENSGGTSKASMILKQAYDLVTERLGSQHPRSLFLGARLLSHYERLGLEDNAKRLLESLKTDLNHNQDPSAETAAEIIATIAKRWESAGTLQAVSLYGMAARSHQKGTTSAASEASLEVGNPKSESPQPGYATTALSLLSQMADRGQLQSSRSMRWLKHSSDLGCLRDTEAFQEIVANVQVAKLLEDATRTSWNLAVMGEHQQAAGVVRDFAASHSELADLGTTQYLFARTWARCYDAAKKEDQDALAQEYLKQCSLSLEACQQRGYFSNSADRRTLAEDDNFEGIKDQIPNFTSYLP